MTFNFSVLVFIFVILIIKCYDVCCVHGEEVKDHEVVVIITLFRKYLQIKGTQISRSTVSAVRIVIFQCNKSHMENKLTYEFDIKRRVLTFNFIYLSDTRY